MALYSDIEWTQSSWNPVTGCTKVSAGCRNCYAERVAMRLRAAGLPNYAHGFKVSLHENTLELPLRWAKPRLVFVNSMSDLFHEEVPDSFVEMVFEVMRHSGRHIFQVLTKRSLRLAQFAGSHDWPSNLWAGVTVEDQQCLGRIEHLRAVPAPVRFLSLEPLLEPLPPLDLKGIGWVIVGGESGPGARPLEREWVVQIRKQCRKADIPFVFKQWGGRHRKQAGRLLDGRTYDEMPKELQLLRNA